MVVPRSGLVVFATVFAASVLIAACTEPTPNYCSLPDHPCPATKMCRIEIHTCVPAEGTGGSSGSGSGGQTGTGGGGDTDAHADADGSPSADGGQDARDAADVHVGCDTNGDCTDAAAPVCERSSGKCVGCLSSATDCQGTKHVCDPKAQVCVGCLASTDCLDKTAPICDAQACRGCRADSECAATAPGICMSHEDGRCATDDETIYVQANAAICSDNKATGGTSTTPFCTSQVGMDAMTTSRRLVVMRGPNAMTEWSFSQTGARVTVAGQAAASISPGGHIGIHVSAGTVTVRDLRIAGGTTYPGVVADGTAELHMDRCVIEDNVGGVQITGSGFDIVNTFIVNNKTATTSGCGAWGGLCVNIAGTPSIARVLNDTIASNKAAGVSCGGTPTVITGSIVSDNTSANNSLCTVTACCDTPMLSADYHLTAASTACIDKLDPSPLVPDDIDGRPRSDAKSDCGADEYGN